MNTLEQQRRRRRAALAGALGGVAGGVAMTVMMTKVAPHVVPQSMRPDKPAPEKAVEWAEQEAGRPDALSGKSEKGAALAAHLAYSAAAGAGYGLVRSALQRVPPPAAGAVFGLTVWAVSFEGLLPAIGVMQRTTEHPPKRWPAPLMGHTIFGVVTAVLAARIDPELA
ncbi:DUF1440 domain-containing protein [Blastococcus capsensis]|uniref:DUF1440 domain-containing protein n=1 Tax=Blastococcus capsensis TaxID=1564163 RepID=UPI0025408B02|nr:DUF1440 domain-containing protein [Blastococcus capsensis]MDK3258722.1 hypothetical protein [Blastococcus capsensis]